MDGKSAKQELNEACERVCHSERRIGSLGRCRVRATAKYHDRISHLDAEIRQAIVKADHARDALRDLQRAAGWVVGDVDVEGGAR